VGRSRCFFSRMVRLPSIVARLVDFLPELDAVELDSKLKLVGQERKNGLLTDGSCLN